MGERSGELGSLANGSCGPSRCQSRDDNSVGHVLILNGTALGDGQQCDRVNSAAYGIMMKPPPAQPQPPLAAPTGTAVSHNLNFGCRHIQYNLCIHITWKGASTKSQRVFGCRCSKPLTHKAPVAIGTLFALFFGVPSRPTLTLRTRNHPIIQALCFQFVFVFVSHAKRRKLRTSELHLKFLPLPLPLPLLLLYR